MKKIIHLSDLHVGHEDCGANFRTIIDNIAFLKQPAENYIVVITGDIVDNANKSIQIDEAVASILLLEKFGYKVLPVPGNHDYGTGTEMLSLWIYLRRSILIIPVSPTRRSTLLKELPLLDLIQQLRS